MLSGIKAILVGSLNLKKKLAEASLFNRKSRISERKSYSHSIING
jgi:hypothetical protein